MMAVSCDAVDHSIYKLDRMAHEKVVRALKYFPSHSFST